MKTKALLLTVALGAAGAATSMAQVYSLNSVGYINVTIPANKLQMVANQLNSGNNTLGVVIPSAPDNTVVYQFLPNGSYDVSTYLGFLGAWDPNPNIPMNPGLGVFIKNASASPLTITFVGEVPQGTLNTTVPLGLSIRSSQVPQAGGLTSVLGYPAADQDRVFQFDNTTGNYKVNTFLGFLGAWDPQEPNLAVGESFFIQSGVTKTWTRTFSVN